MFRIWHLYTVVIISNVISNSYPYSNGTNVGDTDVVSGRTLSGTHRVIKRFTSHFSFPKPKLPTLPRPNFGLPLFSRGLPKGEDEPLPRGNRRKRPRPKKKKVELESEEESPHQDRTLLAAKKALLLKKAIIAKKAIILAKLNKNAKAKKKKKWKKKAVLAAAAAAYGLKKASKIKGLSVKTPSFQVSFGPSKPVKAAEEEAAKVSAEEDEDAISFLTADITEEDTSNSTETDSDGDSGDTEVAAYANQPTEMTLTMMQLLQQQLIEKQKQQQQQQTTPAPQTTAPPPPQQPQIQIELLTAAQPQAPQQQPPPELPPEIIAAGDPEDIDPEILIEAYKGSKSKGKKKAKKKAKKSKPRPVNLGVKANLYKKFDELAKQAHKGIATFIQVDVDFLGRSALDDMIQSGKFIPRTARVSSESPESKEAWGYSVESVQVPANFMPSWSTRNWESKYPRMTRTRCTSTNGGCVLKPVYLLFQNRKNV